MSYSINLQTDNSMNDYSDRIVASGVALLFAYVVNFCFQGIIGFGIKQNQAICLRRLMEVNQVLYWFGVASKLSGNSGMFSIYPPYFYGAFNAIIAFVTLVVLAFMHVFCIVQKKVGERSIFSLLYLIYHILITAWILVGLILAYIWSRTAYDTKTYNLLPSL